MEPKPREITLPARSKPVTDLVLHKSKSKSGPKPYMDLIFYKRTLEPPPKPIMDQIIIKAARRPPREDPWDGVEEYSPMEWLVNFIYIGCRITLGKESQEYYKFEPSTAMVYLFGVRLPTIHFWQNAWNIIDVVEAVERCKDGHWALKPENYEKCHEFEVSAGLDNWLQFLEKTRPTLEVTNPKKPSRRSQN